MSLVYEALQKAEREKERRTGVSPVAPAPVKTAEPLRTAAAPPPAPASRRYLPVLILGVSVLAVAAIAYSVVTAMKNVAPVAGGGSRSSATVPEPATRPEPRPPQATPSPPLATENDARFKLTGIMKMGDSFGAVINGHVVYDGNYVEGAVVKKVERDRVTLDLNGRAVVVRLF